MKIKEYILLENSKKNLIGNKEQALQLLTIHLAHFQLDLTQNNFQKTGNISYLMEEMSTILIELYHCYDKNFSLNKQNEIEFESLKHIFIKMDEDLFLLKKSIFHKDDKSITCYRIENILNYLIIIDEHLNNQ